MKRLAVFFCVLLLFGCGAEGEASFVSSSEASLSNALVLAKHEESHELTTMKLTLEKTQYSLQDEGVTGTLTNHGTTEFLYWEPRDFVLEVKQGERWYSIPQHNRVLADEGHFPILRERVAPVNGFSGVIMIMIFRREDIELCLIMKLAGRLQMGVVAGPLRNLT